MDLLTTDRARHNLHRPESIIAPKYQPVFWINRCSPLERARHARRRVVLALNYSDGAG